MSTDDAQASWTDANQRLLVAEFARLKAMLAGSDAAGERAEVERRHAELPAPAAIDIIEQRFGLSAFERDILLLVAGVEMDSEMAARSSPVAGTTQHAGASFALAMSALPGTHWSALTPARPLRRWRLIDVAGGGSALATSTLLMDERVLHYLAGVNYLDTRLQPLLRRVPVPSLLAAAHEAEARALGAALLEAEAPGPRVQLPGDDFAGKQDVAARVAGDLGLALYAMAEEDIPPGPHDLEALAALWERDAALVDGALLIECGECPASTARRLAERVAGLTFLATREPLALRAPFLARRIDRPDRSDQRRLWERALGGAAEQLNGALDGVCTQFRLSARDIERTGAEFARAAARGASHDQLWQACRGIERARLDGLAQRLEPAADWDDLVLPAAQKDQLGHLACQVKHRMKVHEEWGFARKGARGLGVSALFAGESGTGKTMAAEVLARELHLELFRIDLSAVVSKYIGETEKNLARVFDAAENSGSILLFDEADALFGKRSEVRDSHDRYANIEVSYLLQRMETYRGLAVLTSNQKAALDPAFQRRLRFVVPFPFPGAAEREAIWRSIFPTATPTRDLDYPLLARLHASGGNIRNIALTAAFLAAEEDGPVGMTHLLRAAHVDAAKREALLTESETRGWV